MATNDMKRMDNNEESQTGNVPNEITMAAIEDAVHNRNMSRTYDNIHDLMEDLDN